MKAVVNNVTADQKLASIEKQKAVAAQREEDKKLKLQQDQYKAGLTAKIEGLKLEVAAVELEARFYQADADKQKAMFEKMDYFLKNLELAPKYNEAYKAEQAKALAMQKEELELARARANSQNQETPDQAIDVVPDPTAIVANIASSEVVTDDIKPAA